MSSRELRFYLVVELLIYLAICRLLLSERLNVAETMAAILVMCLATRALAVMLTYGLSAAWPSEVPTSLRQTWFARMYAYSEEWVALVLLSLIIMPFEGWWMGPDRLKRVANSGRPPILLIHGYMANRGFWYWVQRRLEARDWVVATISLMPAFGDIDSYVAQVADRIDDVLAATESERAILVGHSMGGLVSRTYLRQKGFAKVDRLITLGSPHRGTRLAATGLGMNARQMRVGSDWLTNINAPGADHPIPTVAVYSYGDNFVMPQENARLDHIEGAFHIAVASIGHVAMAISPKFTDMLVKILEADSEKLHVLEAETSS